MDTRTVRVLSLYGGGNRGYLSLKFLQRFCQQWGVNSNELWKYFDVIAGTSIGGIIALSLAYGISLETLEPFFLEKAKRIFTIRSASELLTASHNAAADSDRPSETQKAALIVSKTPFYSSPYDDSNYGTNILQQMLVANFGTKTLQDLKTKVLIPSYQSDRTKYVLFSNHSDLMYTGQTEQIVDVARATAAAPAYFPKYEFSNHKHVDGGVYQNNPAESALSLAQMIKPLANRSCLLSVGTGIAEMGFHGSAEPLTDNVNAVADLFSLVNVAITGGQEAADFNLKVRSKRTLEQLNYYLFQPQLDTSQNTELDNSDASFFAYLDTTAANWFLQDSANITTFLGKLTA